MKRLLEVLANVRIVGTELGGTVTLLLLIFYGTYMAWREFIAPLFR